MKESVVEVIILRYFIPVAVAATVYFLFTRAKKSLTLNLISKSTLLYSSSVIKGSLSILYNGVEIKNLSILKYSLKNTGNQPVSSDDYEEKISIAFPNKHTVFSVDNIYKSNSSLNPVLFIEDNTVKIKPLLLNRGDEISFQIVVSDMTELDAVIGYRIKGITKIKAENPLLFETLYTKAVAPILILSFIGVIGAHYISDGTLASKISNAMVGLSAGATIISILGLIDSLIRRKKEKRYWN